MRYGWILLAYLFTAPACAAADSYQACTGELLHPGEASLPPCPNRPNCIFSEGEPGAAPLQAGSQDRRAALRRAILAEPRSRIEIDSETFLVASFRTAVFGFVDEARFVMAASGEIRFRSGACSGYHDFGVNRRRIERIRQRLASDTAEGPQ